MTCEKLAGCPFYNDRITMEGGVGAMYKKKYCEGDNSNCARYVVCIKLGKDAVPDNLFPNMMDSAKQILAKNAA